MDASNSQDAGDRGRRDRRDGKHTQASRSRSPSRTGAADAAADTPAINSKTLRIRVLTKKPPRKRDPQMENLSPRKRVSGKAQVTKTSGVSLETTFSLDAVGRLAAAAKETIAELPRLLSQVSLGGGISAEMAATQHMVYTLRNLKKPDPSECPGLPPTAIRVTREDTLTAAIRLAKEASAAASAAASAKAASKAANKTAEKKKDRNLSTSTASSASSSPEETPYPLIVNFANAEHPGGSWKSGCLAQEEALFYRSSLSLSCNPDKYPLQDKSVLYSPCVFVIREEYAAGHKLLKPEEFPVISAVSVAALKHPAVRKVQTVPPFGQTRTSTPSSPRARSRAQSSTKKDAKAATDLASAMLPPSRRPTADAAEPGTFFYRSPFPDEDQVALAAAIAAGADWSSGYPAQRRPLPPPRLLTTEDFMRPITPPPPPPAVTPRSLRPRHTAGSAAAFSGPYGQLPTIPIRKERSYFADKTDRNTTKTKMRLVLRAAAAHGHRQLVLGALGCGMYANPPDDVALCWLEVLQENEFLVPADQPGGLPKHWWKDVVFAVYEKPKRDNGISSIDPNSNYEIFRRTLDGHLV